MVCCSVGVSVADGPSSKENEAYEHNRAGMVNMSMARFEEAIAEFNQAAALLPDYQIQGRPLIYTPIFMTGWAYEKIGLLKEACEHYRRFLEIAPPETGEETKAQHAREVLEKCRRS
jgi:tetratricopeptide (TPR) repeat protein